MAGEYSTTRPPMLHGVLAILGATTCLTRNRFKKNEATAEVRGQSKGVKLIGFDANLILATPIPAAC